MMLNVQTSMFCDAKRAETYLICVKLCTVAFLSDEYLSRNVESFNKGQQHISRGIQFDSGRSERFNSLNCKKPLQNCFY